MSENLAGRKALVLGANRFVGKHLVEKLISESVEVDVIDKSGKAVFINEVNIKFSDYEKGLEQSIIDSDFIYYINNAYEEHLYEGKDFFTNNREALIRVMNLVAKHNDKRSVFVASASSFGFGSKEQSGTEESAFAQSYSDFEEILNERKAVDLVLEYVKTKNLDGIIAAPSFILGSSDDDCGYGCIIKNFIEQQPKTAPKGGNNFVSVKDVTNALFSMLSKGNKGESYILGGENLSYREFFTKLGQIAGIDPLLKNKSIAGFFNSFWQSISGSSQTYSKLPSISAYYSSEKAVKKLSFEQTQLHLAMEESIHGLIQNTLLFKDAEKFKNKVAIVTGASRGVGFAIAREFVKRGAKVVITARGKKRLEDSLQKLKRIGGQVVAVDGDIGNWADVRKMIGAAHDNFGKIDILVNNAGISMRGKFQELTPEVCKNTIETNLLGSIYTTKAAIDDLIETKGSVVYISSIAGLFGLPGASTYCAGKAALTGLSESIRLELIPKGVHSGVVYLGFTEHDPEKRILAADGTPVLPDRPAHHTQVYAASLAIGLINKRKRKVIMTPAGVLGWLAYRFSPSFVEWAILKAQSMQTGLFKKFS